MHAMFVDSHGILRSLLNYALSSPAVPSRSPDKDGANVIAVGRIAPHHRIVFEDGSHRERESKTIVELTQHA
jgi:hypothetical protein